LSVITSPKTKGETPKMLRITADIFSGRPNPEWEAGDDEAKSLLQEIARNREAIGTVDGGATGLGYRGLIVESLADNITGAYDLPPVLRIAHNSNAKGLEIGDRVLTSMLRSQVIDNGLHQLLAGQLQTISRAPAQPFQEDVTEGDQAVIAAPPAEARLATAAVVCQIELGAFNPGFWNAAAHIGKNNCYNYASNRRTDTFAQPGRATGKQASVMACPDVTTAALSDGLHHRFNCFPASESPRWLMALVVAPGYDYHWYRKQKEGFWGHKPGGTAARNYDNNNKIVWNPETAARGPYTNFCGYFYACRSQKIK
jgi:hypothetical protein